MARCDVQQLGDAHVGASVSNTLLRLDAPGREDVAAPTTRVPGPRFGEGETRRALSDVLTHMGNEPNLEQVLRSALEQLSAHKISRASARSRAHPL
jgi:hypothetical protein